MVEEERRLDLELASLHEMGEEMLALVGLAPTATPDEFNVALESKWATMTEERKSRIADIAAEASQIGKRLMSQIEDLAPEAGELKRKFALDAAVLGNPYQSEGFVNEH